MTYMSANNDSTAVQHQQWRYSWSCHDILCLPESCLIFSVVEKIPILTYKPIQQSSHIKLHSSIQQLSIYQILVVTGTCSQN